VRKRLHREQVALTPKDDMEWDNKVQAWITKAREAGKKYDQGKPMVDLIVPEFIEGLAKVMTMGAEKYGIENWKKGLDKRRILAALYRHLLAYHKGEVYDSESKLNHLLHVAANTMFLFWYDEVHKQQQNTQARCDNDCLLCDEDVCIETGEPRD
jgi:hypothetical protein